MKMKIRAEATREQIQDLNKFYGIYIEKELSRILAMEIENALEINEENLRNDGWEFGKHPTTEKSIWFKIDSFCWIDVNKNEKETKSLSYYVYDMERGTLDHNGNELTISNKMSDLRLYLGIIKLKEDEE